MLSRSKTVPICGWGFLAPNRPHPNKVFKPVLPLVRFLSGSIVLDPSNIIKVIFVSLLEEMPLVFP